MARHLTSAALTLLLVLAAWPARGAITIPDTEFYAIALAAFDEDGDGILEAGESEQGERTQSDGLSFFESFGRSTAGSSGAADQDTIISATATRVDLSSNGSCSGSSQAGGDSKQGTGQATFDLLFNVTAPTRLLVAASYTASADAQAFVFVADLGGEIAGDTAVLDEELTLAPGTYAISVFCHASTFFFPANPNAVLSASASWSLTVELSEEGAECESEQITWAGGRAGGFDVPENWDPPQVPFSDGATRCDEVLVEGGRGIVVDLDAAAPASLGATAPAPVRRVWSFEAIGSSALRPVDGTLEAQSPSRIIGERSIELRAGGSLLLDGGAVLAQSVAVGTSGDGAIEVVGTRGLLIAEGRLGIGAGGAGRLLARDGTTVISGDAVLGETEGSGTAVVRGDATTWNSGDLTVGRQADGTLTIEGGGQVTSGASEIDSQLDGDERGSVEVRGATPGGTPSQWSLSSLDVYPRGSLYLADRGKVHVSGALSIGGGGAESDCDAGLACVNVFDGQLDAHGVLVGNVGGGTLKIGPSGLVAATGQFGIGNSAHGSQVLIEGPTENASVFSGLTIATEPGATGKLEIGVGGRLDLLGRFRVGGGVAGSLGTFTLVGDAADPEATRVSALDGSGLDSVVGGPDPLPPNRYGGQLQIESAALELSGAGHDLVIERNGFLNGGNARIALAPGAKLVNKGALVGGGFLIQGDYDQAETGFLNASVLELPPGASPQGMRSLAAAPAPPPFEPLVVTGNAELAGQAVLQFGNGAAPGQGDAFELLQVEGEVTGAFDAVEVKGLVPGTFDFDATIANGAVVLTSLTDAQPLPFVNLAGKPLLLESKKAAKLKLTRSGDTAAPLTVAYTVGGTAEGGVDFVALPGAIEFPARRKSVTLLVQPIADALAEGSETIEIALAPDASFAPGLASQLTIELRDGK